MSNRTESISILKVEIDGHFHGSSNVPKPWVAEITGVDRKYGLARQFLDTMNDWRDARAARSGNIYGVVAHFALRDGRLYEVSRCRGNPSKRRVVREFVRADAGKFSLVDPEEALAIVDGGAPAVIYRMPEDPDGESWCSRLLRLGTPDPVGFVVRKDERIYRLLIGGVYEVVRGGHRGYVGVHPDSTVGLSEQEAWRWLMRQRESA